jgi:intergrase/recombinase
MMNGKYFYYFTLSQKDTERLKNKIYRVMSHRADKWDKKFASDTLTNLQVILEEVQQKDKY